MPHLHTATVTWRLDPSASFPTGAYSRAHSWRFDGGLRVPASASPHVVGPRWSDSHALDPEEAFVASLASCHMLWFLSLAARRGLTVEQYRDDAEGMLAPGDDGQLCITSVRLRPRVWLSPADAGRRDELAALHEEAHHECFLARSVRCPVEVDLGVGGDGALEEPDTLGLLVEELLPDPMTRAFAALHTPSAIRHAWGAARVLVDPRVGGTWAAAFGKDEDRPEDVVTARIAVFDPPRRMELHERRRFPSEDGVVEVDLTTDFRISPHQGGALLQVHQHGFPANARFKGAVPDYGGRWRAILDRLHDHLRT